MGPGVEAFAGEIASFFIIWERGLGAHRVVAAFWGPPSVVVRGADLGLGLQAAGRQPRVSFSASASPGSFVHFSRATTSPSLQQPSRLFPALPLLSRFLTGEVAGLTQKGFALLSVSLSSARVPIRPAISFCPPPSPASLAPLPFLLLRAPSLPAHRLLTCL